MPSKVNVDDLDERHLEDFEPALKAVGYHLRPENMRPSVWEFEAGEANERHRHERQEELYLLLEGRARLEHGDETTTMEAGDVAVLAPDTWRQLTAIEPCTLFAVGAPNVEHDAVF